MAAPTPADLRAAFPEFVDPPYTDATINYWLGIATKMVNVDRWGELYAHGVLLFTAHMLALARRSQVSVAGANGIPGIVTGVLSSKSADGLSASYDVSSITEENAGHWNLTMYGLQYIRAARMMGAGPIHIGLPKPDDFQGGYFPGVIMPVF